MNEKGTLDLMLNILTGTAEDKLIKQLKLFCFIQKKPKGEILFIEHTKGSYIYFLINGKIKLYRTNEKGNECLIRFVNSNEFFAEILLTQDIYPVTAQTVSGSTLMLIDKNKLLEILKIHPEFSLHIIQMFAKRINYLMDTIERISTQDAKEKFLNYIHYLSKIQDSLTVDLDIPKQDLALLLGMAKETFSRVEKQLIREGIIKVNNKQIKILKGILP